MLPYKNKIIAIIPARAGSKRLPNKNNLLLNNKPLISYTIEEAIKSKYIDYIVISTDSDKIIKTAERYDEDNITIIKRPKRLATDESPITDTILHIIYTLNYENDAIVLLQPTSPLRTSEDIDMAIKLFRLNNDNTVISVSEMRHSPYWALRIENDLLTPLLHSDQKWMYFNKRSQDLDKCYVPNGAVYICQSRKLIEHNTFYIDPVVPYIMSVEKSIDIDEEIDFRLAELLIKRLKK